MEGEPGEGRGGGKDGERRGERVREGGRVGRKGRKGRVGREGGREGGGERGRKGRERLIHHEWHIFISKLQNLKSERGSIHLTVLIIDEHRSCVLNKSNPLLPWGDCQLSKESFCPFHSIVVQDLYRNGVLCFRWSKDQSPGQGNIV